MDSSYIQSANSNRGLNKRIELIRKDYDEAEDIKQLGQKIDILKVDKKRIQTELESK